MILENVSPAGEELPGSAGRLLNPGKISTLQGRYFQAQLCLARKNLQL